jgi:hypothetical protein
MWEIHESPKILSKLPFLYDLQKRNSLGDEGNFFVFVKNK